MGIASQGVPKPEEEEKPEGKKPKPPVEEGKGKE